jgi:hypothetical protein
MTFPLLTKKKKMRTRRFYINTQSNGFYILINFRDEPTYFNYLIFFDYHERRFKRAGGIDTKFRLKLIENDEGQSIIRVDRL